MPRGWDPEHTYHNATLPPVRVLQQLSSSVLSAAVTPTLLTLSVVQVRLVSQEVLFTHNDNISLDSTLSHLLVEWGQWIDHDVVQTPQSPSTAAFRTGADCTHTCSRDTPCFPIQVHFTISCFSTVLWFSVPFHPSLRSPSSFYILCKCCISS